MPSCAVKGCRNYFSITSKSKNVQEISYHRFPNDAKRKEIWSRIIRIQRNDPYFRPHSNARICSAHFSEEDVVMSKGGLRKLKGSAIPRLNVQGAAEFLATLMGEAVSENVSGGQDSDSDGLIEDPGDLSGYLVFKDALATSAATGVGATQSATTSRYGVGHNQGEVEKIVIREEISEEEKNQCRLCLNVGRRLRELAEYAPLYRKLLFGNCPKTPIPSFMCEMLACWECRAELRRIQKFQDKVRRANMAFQTNQNQNCEDLSSLCAILISEATNPNAEIEPASTVEERAKKIKQEAVEVEEVEVPEVEELALPDPLAGCPGQIVEQTVNIEYEPYTEPQIQKSIDEPKLNVTVEAVTRDNKGKARSKQIQVKRVTDVSNVPEQVKKKARLMSSSQEKSQGADDTTQTSQTHDVTAGADAPLDCDAIFAKVKIEFEELQSILSDRRDKDTFKSMQYKCDSCVLGFTDQSRLDDHNRKYHDEDAGSFECDICQRRFIDKQQLQPHRRSHFVKFACQLCRFECYTKTGRAVHLTRHRDAVRGAEPDAVLRQKLVRANRSSS